VISTICRTAPRGPTRGDHLADVNLEGGCSELLTLLSEELLPAAVS
jgi:hypothetical protein